MEILQTSNSTELFAPDLEDERKLKTADPVTNDLLGALLSVGLCYLISTLSIYKQFTIRALGFYYYMSLFLYMLSNSASFHFYG